MPQICDGLLEGLGDIVGVCDITGGINESCVVGFGRSLDRCLGQESEI